MKIRAAKNIHNTEKTFDEFKLTEFSKDLVEFIPDLTLSCNECTTEENDQTVSDSSISFLVKFKADKLKDPRKIKNEGISGMFLPELEEYKYEKEAGEDSCFRTIKENHYNLILSEKQLNELARDIFADTSKQVTHFSREVSSYIVSVHEKAEWVRLFNDAQKKNWKKYLKECLKAQFKSTYCDFKKDELKQMLGVDPDNLKKNILKLNKLGFLDGVEINEIRQVLGKDFV